MSTVNYVEPVVVEEPKPVNWAEFSLKSMVNAYGLSAESAAELHAYSDYRDAAGLIPLVLRHWNNQQAFLAELRTTTQEAFEPWQFNDIVGAVLLLVSEKEPEHILFTREEGHFTRPRRRQVREEAPQVDPMASTVQELVQQVANLTQQLSAAPAAAPAAPEPVIEAVLEEEPIDLMPELEALEAEEDPFELPGWLLEAPVEPDFLGRRSIFDDLADEDDLDWLGSDDADDGLIEFVEPEPLVEEPPTAVPAPRIPAPAQKAHWLIRGLAWVDKQASRLNG